MLRVDARSIKGGFALFLVIFLPAQTAMAGNRTPVDEAAVPCGRLIEVVGNEYFYRYEVSNSCNAPIYIDYRCDGDGSRRSWLIAGGRTEEIGCDKKRTSGKIYYDFRPMR